jgi:glycosyltransferase involved in cell wall biosynthesis
MKKRAPGITAFFPVYNDGATIASMVLTADMTLRALTRDYEIIAVDDGSQDASPEVLRELREKVPHLRVITHPANRGYGAALRTGFANARKELIFYTDGDGQYDVRELLLLMRGLRDGVDIVNGYKMKRHDPWHRLVIGTVYHWAVKVAFGLPLRDTDCDFRLIRRRVFQKVRLGSDTGCICVEMVKKLHDAGFVFAEAPVHHFFRTHGRSQFFNFKRIFRTLVDLSVLWFRLVLLGRKG